MKHNVWIASAGFFMCVLAHETLRATEPQIVEVGPHHRVIQRVVMEPQPDGTMAERVSRYTELSTGLHFRNASGDYVLSQARFRLFPGGAVADEGPFRLIVSPDLAGTNQRWTCKPRTPNGGRFPRAGSRFSTETRSRAR